MGRKWADWMAERRRARRVERRRVDAEAWEEAWDEANTPGRVLPREDDR